jgi:8-oxo-dGTP pyrophosphatase MutT (NUDIX family)
MRDKLRALFASLTNEHVSNSGRIPSAVLVPLFCKDEQVHILFTKRSENVMHHKGEISFPGGAFGSPDRELKETALRETWEEIGLNPQDVEIIGELGETETLTSNYVIKPFVGLIPYPYDFVPNPHEIAKILIVPLPAFLKNKGSKTDEEQHGYLNDEYTYTYGDNLIWGATAIILRQLLQLLKSCCGARNKSC